MLGLVNYEDSDDDAPEAPAPTNGHEKAAPVAPSQAQASPPSASPPSGPSGSPPQEEERKGAIKRVSHAPSDLVRRPTIGPPPASRDWSNPYVLERLVQEMGLKRYGSNFPKEMFDPEHVEHPSDFYDAPDCERPPPPKRKKAEKQHKSPAPGVTEAELVS
ncbi:Leucine-zipper-like transcriptional regulator 1 [Durusdinium trenchii]|uniref:Leucine-zipper-like transcriptional regulator 1 n=1 Tax=Durusdinium trenchii TaxID=1381693 RepID=A0ABP0K7X2_9DINO